MGGCVPNWNVASGLETHLPSPQTEQPPAGVTGHSAIGTPSALHSHTPISEGIP
jgi:hypothetical protein